MGLFGRNSDSRRVADLEDEVAKLKRAFASLEMDWLNVQDKLKRMLMRTVKRAEVAEKLEAAREELADVTDVTPPATNGAQSGRLMTARQRQLQQEILTRRAGLTR